ncbi:MAG: hypothetical protein JNJ52_11785 [Flavobacterium sp.]|nr:hypothetical protein [Flavobacterium sp.]
MKKNYSNVLSQHRMLIWLWKGYFGLLQPKLCSNLLTLNKFKLMILLLVIISAESNAQTFSSTWNLTSNGNATTAGTISAAAASNGSGINTPT